MSVFTGSVHRRVAFLVCPTGFEPATFGVGVQHSIQLSYGHMFLFELRTGLYISVEQMSKGISKRYHISVGRLNFCTGIKGQQGRGICEDQANEKLQIRVFSGTIEKN